MKKNKILFFSILIILIVLLNECAAPRYQAGRNYLIKGTEEKTGYGLYSYILFSKNPDEHSQSKYLALMVAYLNNVSEIDGLESYISRDSLNIVYIPLVASPTDDFKHFDNKQKAMWLINNYDYARARYYLNKFERELIEGPYIVSYKIPIVQASMITNEYLIQDLSYVHHRVVSLWMDEYLKQSSKTEYWDREYLMNFVNDLRNSIAIAADGLEDVSESLNWWKESLKDWIALK